MIELQNLTIGNHSSQPLASRVSLTLPDATLTALVGRNGCGKSTLLRALGAIQRPLEGKVTIDGKEICRMSARELAATVAVVTTEAVKIPRLTCRELVALGRAPHTGLFGRLDADDDRAVDEALESVGMSAFASRPLTGVSDGEGRRIMLARALAQDTPVILLDEPTSFLDVPGRFEIGELLRRLAREQGKTIVYSTHELEPALRFADSMLFMFGGGVIQLPPSQMRELPEFIQTMRLDLRG